MCKKTQQKPWQEAQHLYRCSNCKWGTFKLFNVANPILYFNGNEHVKKTRSLQDYGYLSKQLKKRTGNSLVHQIFQMHKIDLRNANFDQNKQTCPEFMYCVDISAPGDNIFRWSRKGFEGTTLNALTVSNYVTKVPVCILNGIECVTLPNGNLFSLKL